MRGELGARLIMHDADAEIVERGDNRLTAAFCFGVAFRPLAIDMKLSGSGGVIPFDGQDIFFLHTPGHTPGSISSISTPTARESSSGRTSPRRSSRISIATRWRGAIPWRNFLALKADVLCDGHSGVYRPADKVAAYIRHFVRLYRERGSA